MATKSVRRSISMTPEMRDLLAQIAAKYGREVSENDIIRDAIRHYLDQQADVVGSRRHFQRSLQARLDRLESTLTFQMLMLTFLMATVLGMRATKPSMRRWRLHGATAMRCSSRSSCARQQGIHEQTDHHPGLGVQGHKRRTRHGATGLESHPQVLAIQG